MKIIICFALLACSSAFDFYDEPEEIAPYTVIKDMGSYEIREYAPANWVCHDDTGRQPKMYKSFMKLFGYITGFNEGKVEINMTAPVTMKTQLSDGKEPVFQMCFYLPAAFQESPPTPSDPEVYIENRPHHYIASRTFGGYMVKMRDWKIHKDQLEADLKAAEEPGVDYSSFYGAGYDGPMKQKDRRNEVWFLVKH